MNVRRSLFPFLVALLFGVGCASTPDAIRGPPGRPLEGAVLPLASSMGRALEVEGRVGPHAARVHLDSTRPRTLVSEGCLRGVQVVQEGGRVSIPDAFGEVETVEELGLRDLSVGGRRLTAMQVGLRQGRACEVWLGLDVLAGYALEWDPLRREIRFSAPLGAEAYPLIPAGPGEQVGLVRLSREPRTDIPLMPIRLSLETLQFAGTFLLATAEERSQLFLPPGALEAAAALGDEEVIAPKALEVAPDLSLQYAPLHLAEQGQGALMGVLGADIWGRLDAVLDLRAGVLRLSRSGAATRPCRDSTCLEAIVLERPGGRLGSVRLRGVLPEGGRFRIRALDAEGTSLCALEVSFPMSGAGETLAFPLSGEDAVGGGCAMSAASLRVEALQPVEPARDLGVCVAAEEGEVPLCRAGSLRGRRPLGERGARPEATEELTEPEDPPPLPVRPRSPRP